MKGEELDRYEAYEKREIGIEVVLTLLPATYTAFPWKFSNLTLTNRDGVWNLSA